MVRLTSKLRAVHDAVTGRVNRAIDRAADPYVDYAVVDVLDSLTTSGSVSDHLLRTEYMLP